MDYKRAGDHETLYLECSCGLPDHIVRVALDRYEWKNGSEVYLTIDPQLSPFLGFWKRIWAAIRYVFKPHGTCSYGGWAECQISNVERAKALRDLIDRGIVLMEKKD